MKKESHSIGAILIKTEERDNSQYFNCINYFIFSISYLKFVNSAFKLICDYSINFSSSNPYVWASAKTHDRPYINCISMAAHLTPIWLSIWLHITDCSIQFRLLGWLPCTSMFDGVTHTGHVARTGSSVVTLRLTTGRYLVAPSLDNDQSVYTTLQYSSHQHLVIYT